MRRARIIGTGLWVPPNLVTNEELSKIMGKPVGDNIPNKLGIKQRYYTGDDYSSADLGYGAAKEAISNAGLKPEDIDLIIVATDTPEYLSPSTSCVIQGRLGAVKAGCFDLNASCAGFVTALDTASRMIGFDNTYQNVLVIGVYNMTKYADMMDEHVAPIFADGGGAVVLQAQETDLGYQSAYLYADGTQYDFLGIFYGGTKHPMTVEAVQEKKHLLTFLKPLPPQRNIELWPQCVPKALERAGLTVKDVDHFLFTQINRWVIEEVMKVLNQPMEKTTCVMDRFGYTGSACIPMALHVARQEGRVKPGDTIVMVGSGVGLSVGTAVFKL